MPDSLFWILGVVVAMLLVKLIAWAFSWKCLICKQRDAFFYSENIGDPLEDWHHDYLGCKECGRVFSRVIIGRDEGPWEPESLTYEELQKQYMDFCSLQ